MTFKEASELLDVIAQGIGEHVRYDEDVLRMIGCLTEIRRMLTDCERLAAAAETIIGGGMAFAGHPMKAFLDPAGVRKQEQFFDDVDRLNAALAPFRKDGGK